MKKTKLTRSLMAACSIVALSAVMYGCVHSGDSETAMDDPPPPMQLTLPDGHQLMAADQPLVIQPGGSATVGRTTVTCPEGGEACTINLSAQPGTGNIVATYTGATPMVTVAEPPPPPMYMTLTLPADHQLMASDEPLVIEAGGSATVGRTTVSCPAGGEDCTIMVSAQAVTGDIVASYLGAEPMVTVEPLPPEPMYAELTLPEGHQITVSDTASENRLVIPAGESVMVGDRTTIECPAGGEACTIMVSEQAITGNIVASYLGANPTVTVAPMMYAVDLPAKHSLMAGDEIEVEAGESVEQGGVSFTCPEGDDDCVVTISEDEDGELVASSIGAQAMAEQDPAAFRGYTAFSDLSDTILNTTELTDLQTNLYHSDANGGGVTSSVTTHEDPGEGADPNVTGVSDIAVTVEAMDEDPTRDDDTKEISVVDRDELLTAMMIDVDINDPYMKDGSTAWTGDIDVEADWDSNPAAEWSVEDLDLGDDANLDDDPDDIWTAYFQHTQDLPGGRELELDVKTDYVPGDAALMAPIQLNNADDNTNHYQGFPIIARGSASDVVEVTAPWNMLMSLDDTFPLARGTEIDMSTDGGEGLEGSFMGVRGRFVCVDGMAGGASAVDRECEIDHQTNGQMGVSEGDLVVFIPYVHSGDVDWLTAGVWLTIPDDLDDGDYAIGSFVYGNDPVEYDADADPGARGLMGTATYNGEAFGRYAEDMEVGEGAKMTGRFTADATLTADFDANGGATGGTGNDFGTIEGDLTNFMADGVARENWDVNFETATLMLGETPGPNEGDPAVLSGALRFNAAASGHAGAMGDEGGGHGLTGYWNGQFYGDPLAVHNDNDPLLADVQDPWDGQPGTAAGTFGLTSERDADDDYSLIMQGAFSTHWSDED